MAKENLYWIAPGVVSVGDKKYGINDALPIDKIDKDKLKRWKESGKIGAKVAPVKAEDKTKELTARIAELETELADANGTIADLEKDLDEATKEK